MTFFRLVLVFAAVLMALAAALVVFLWGQSSINGWHTWAFRLTHRVLDAQDQPTGSRVVRVQLKSGQQPLQVARACANAFEKQLLSEGLTVECRVFRTQAEADDPNLTNCEVASSEQFAYSGAEQAEIRLNTPAANCPSHP